MDFVKRNAHSQAEINGAPIKHLGLSFYLTSKQTLRQPVPYCNSYSLEFMFFSLLVISQPSEHP